MAHAPPHALGDRLPRRCGRRKAPPDRKVPSRELAPRLRRRDPAPRLRHARAHPGLRSPRPLRRTSQPPLLPRCQATGRPTPRRAQVPRHPPPRRLHRSRPLPRPIRPSPGPVPDRHSKPPVQPDRLPHLSRVGPANRPPRRSSASRRGHTDTNNETNPISPNSSEINGF